MPADDRTASDTGIAWIASTEHQNRSRNLLARVRSVLSRMADSDASAADFAAHLEGRLSALWRVEEAYLRGGADLELTLLDTLQTLGTPDNTVTLKGPGVQLSTKASSVLILALHELATNALKFGAFSRSEGQLAVSWTIRRPAGGARLSLKWEESGVEVVLSDPPHEGFGYDLISRRIAYELGGTGQLLFGSTGATCLIEIPLEA